MSVLVRLQNFQSIEDASIEIDGFTVVTGPNNSGKSALMRAIRGVFTNAPAGSLVRHGCPHLTVDMTFEDAVVRWEKGKKINRYTLNGKVLDNVGRGVPPEVAAIGLQEVKAASDRLWPQIAEQFGGVLFLVDRPGSVVAEALSDVDRVGKLSDALRLSESDRRSITSELKIRRKDAVALKEEFDSFGGLDEAALLVEGAVSSYEALSFLDVEVQEVANLKSQLESTKSVVLALDGFDPSLVPPRDQVRDLRDLRVEVQEVATLRRQLLSSEDAVGKAVGVLEAVEKHPLPSDEGVGKLARAIKQVQEFQTQRRKAREAVERLESELRDTGVRLSEAQESFWTVLGDRGICPTCETVFDEDAPLHQSRFMEASSK